MVWGTHGTAAERQAALARRSTVPPTMTAKTETDDGDVQPSKQAAAPQSLGTLLLLAGSSAVGVASTLVVLPRVAGVAADVPTVYVVGAVVLGFTFLAGGVLWRRSL